MEVIDTIDDWREIKRGMSHRSLGLVPTMGALHHGHLTLVRQSMRENEVTSVSVFVNPAQFNNPDDLQSYPRDMAGDKTLLDREGVDYLFAPRRYEEIYPDDYRYKVSESILSAQLCGKNRPGHFDGVLTIILKLFNIIGPDRAYFGEKDYQQLLLIKDMTRSLFLPVSVIALPIVREEDGLAMSSRNRLLSNENRILAGKFPHILRESDTCHEAIEQLIENGIEVDYIKEMHGRRFGAIKIAGVRLIDNVPI